MTSPIMSLNNIFLAFGKKELFSDTSLHIYERDRICLVGKNGEGKSTLMKVISSIHEPDKGDIWTMPGLKISYLPQQTKYEKHHKVIDYLLQDTKNTSLDYLAEKYLEPLKIDPESYMDNLSGGQLRRASIAKVLMEEPNLLLLDEPTNHLDISTIEWLEEYLKKFKGAILCISHDRSFLRNISNKTVWLDRSSLRVLNKGYAHYDEWSLVILEQEQRELDNLAGKLREEELWKIQGVTARRKRNQRRLKELYDLREKLQTRKAKLKKLTNAIKLDPLQSSLHSKLVSEFTNVSFSYGEKKMVEELSMRIMRGDKIGIIGSNGSGKTTFLKLMIGDLKPDQGHIKLGKNITPTYFDQNRQYLDPDETLWKTLCPTGGDRVKVGERYMHVVAYLKKFMFAPEDVRDRVACLSGGQQNRLLLAKALADPGGVLILDEPTNDLDMDTLDMIQEILADYKGTLVLVSHDRDFIDRLITKTLVFHGDGDIDEVIGGYSDYMSAIGKGKVEKKKVIKNPKVQSASDKLSYKLQRELDLLPKEIAETEQNISEIEQELSDPELFVNDAEKFSSLTEDLEFLKSELEKKLDRLVSLEELAKTTSVS